MKRNRLTIWLSVICLSVCLILPLAVFTAGAEDVTHEVSFYIGEGNLYETQDVQDGGHAAVPETPTKEGSVFLYWKLDDTKYSFRTAVTTDISLVAAWQELSEQTVIRNLYTVKFRVGGTVVSQQDVESGEDAIAPTDFECPEGKQFVGWIGTYTNVTKDVTITAQLADKVYTVDLLGPDGEVLETQNVSHGESVDLSDLPVIAHYQLNQENPYTGTVDNICEDGVVQLNYLPDTSTVTFYVDGEVYGEEQKVEYGKTARFPTVPVKEHYIFIGWYANAKTTVMYDFNTPVTENLSLTARYVAIENPKHEVIFLQSDGSQYGGTQLVEEGQNAIVPGTPYRDGYTFVGWVDDSTGEAFDFTKPVTSDLTIRAQFRIRTFTVTVTAEDQVISTQLVYYGGDAEEPAAPEIEGYLFAGYDGSFRDIRRDTEIHAIYIERTFVVMFFDQNNKKIGATQYVTYGDDATAPADPVKEGYEFVGWTESCLNVKADMVLFPVFKQLEFTVRYLDGTEVLATETVTYGQLAVTRNAEKEGYLFAGWFTEDGAEYDFNTPVTANLTLVATWTEKPALTHQVVFYVDGVAYNTQTVADGSGARTPANPTKYGYTFTGWDKEYANVTSDLSVNAVFAIKTYTVTFIADKQTLSTVQVNYNEKVAPPESPEKEGYEFTGWSYDLDQPVTEDLTVRAVFRVKTFTVLFVVEGETVDTQTVEYGGYANVPETPKVEGKTFAGWRLPDGSKYTFSNPVTSDLTVTANFRAAKYLLSYYINGKLYAEQEYEVGETIVPAEMPEDFGDTVIFSGWTGIPDVMPMANVSVYATAEFLNYYTIYYYVDGSLFAEVSLLEGEQVTPMEAPAFPSDEILFEGWIDEPTVMPSEDVVVEAKIRKLYTIIYLVDGREYATVSLYEGDEVQAMEEPQLYDSHIVFVRWIDEPTVMPSEDVVVEAKIRKLYTIIYSVDGREYATVSLYEGDAVPAMETPQLYDSHIVFVRWIDEPTVMPDYDVFVEAEIQKSYTVTYWVDGSLYASYLVMVGDPIPTPDTPASTSASIEFSGWSEIPETMPEEDISVTGYFIDNNKVNLFVLETGLDDNRTATVLFNLTGTVQTAGFIGNIQYTGATVTNIEYDMDCIDARDYGGEIRFVWTSGTNLTDTKTFLTIEFALKDMNAFLKSLKLEIDEIYMLTSDNGITRAEYCIG